MRKCLIALLFLSSSCASIDATKLILDKHSTTSCVNISVKDLRPYVQSGAKRRNYIGIVQGAHGEAFEFTSSPRSTLAKDIGLAIKDSLETMVFSASYVEPEQVSIRSPRNCKTLILSYKELKLDSRINGWFTYDAELELYSSKRKLIATSHTQGRKEVEGGHFFPASAARKNAVNHTRIFIEELLSDPRIRASL